MFMKERAIDAGAISGTVLLVVAAWWTAGRLHDRGQPGAAAAPRPSPTRTVTVTPSPAPSSSTRARPTSVASTTVTASGPAGTTGPAAAIPPYLVAGGPSGGQMPRPSPTRTVTATPVDCGGEVLTVRAARLLCASIGGR